MTNHNPTFTSSAASGSFSENANTTGSSALHTLSGTMAFKDSDKTDTHTTTAALKSAVWSGGSGIPAGSLAHFNSAMSSQILTDSNGNGTLKWTFSDPDSDFDFLAKNQTLVLTYNITVSDNHGGSVKQTVTVTITGTDDKPVIDIGAHAVVNEQDGHLLSFSPDTAHIALHFTDVDLTDTGHTATVVGVSASGNTDGLLPGALGTAELMAFYHIDNVVKASGSSSGTINSTFSAPDLAFDYLADGETLNILYTVQIDDHAGGVTTQTVTVTVVGSNDAPIFLCGPESAHLTEGEHLSPAGALTAHGDLLFTDIDLSDTHAVSTTVTAARSGGGAIPLSNADLLAAFSTSLDDSDGHLLGDVDWAFALQNSAASFLSAGEILTLTYHVIVTDPAGGSDSQIVTITILGTNHPVAFTSGPDTGATSELADTTGSSVPDTAGPGTLTFADQDLGDTHTVAVTVASAAWSGGTTPAATQADLAAALATTLHDSTGTGAGTIDWSFAVPDHDLDFLAAGESLTVTYNVKVADGSTNATQTVSITIDGANDAAVITSGPQAGSVAELPNTTGSSALDTTSPVPTGTLSFSDADLNDLHQVDVSVASAVWSAQPDFVPPDTLADLLAALTTTLHDSTGSGAGGVDWTFSIPDRDLDFLGAGETLTVTYNVTVTDGTSSSTQTVTVTATGAEDPLVVNPITAAVADTAGVDDGQPLAAGNLILDGGDSGGDTSVTLAITEVNGVAANVGTNIAGIYGRLFVGVEGAYVYTANSTIDPFLDGQTASEHFNFTVTDSLGRSASSTLTFNITGTDDAPTITAADTIGSMTEDLGPSVVVNGGFETGDLTGWSRTGTHVFVQIPPAGGQFGQFAAKLAPNDNFSESLDQFVVTNPGQHYTLSFFVTGDADSSSNFLSVSWDGTTLLAINDGQSGAFTRYSFDVVGNATNSSTQLDFTYRDDGTGLFIDQVAVESASGAGTESANGSISFADIETGDTHTASFAPQSADYVGTFSLDPLTEVPGSGSVAWHFTVDNADIQFLSQGQALTQVYTVLVTDNHGVSTPQDVTITINGSNDAPTAVGETVITDVGPTGTVDIPAWALATNDTDPDMQDVLFANSILSSSGGTAVPFGDAFFIDDGTLGGSFTYNVSDGIAVSGNAATATIVNNVTTATALVGTSGDDILIGNNGSETLSGGGGNDILIGNSGSHVMTGGTGNDIFAFQQPTDGLNTITDFNNTTEHDRIAISAANFGAGLTAGMDTTPVLETSGADQFGFFGAVFHYDTANQTLYFSADGTTASAVVLAQLQPGADLHAHDLLIV